MNLIKNIIERPRYVCETFIHKIMSIFDQNKMKNEYELIKKGGQKS